MTDRSEIRECSTAYELERVTLCPSKDERQSVIDQLLLAISVVRQATLVSHLSSSTRLVPALNQANCIERESGVIWVSLINMYLQRERELQFY